MASSTYAFLEGGEGSDAAIEMLMQVRYKDACEPKSTHETGTSDRTESESRAESEEGTDSGQRTETEDEADSNDGFGSEDWPEDLPTYPASWNDRCMPPLDDDIWTSVKAVFDLPWFRRVWIIQEVVAAPIVKIVCGKWIIDWNDLHLATEIIDREVQGSDDDFSQLQKSWEPFLSLAAQREWEARQYRWTLFMLLENYRYAESTRSRDHFFALLGLASDGNETTFEPDYDSPLEAIVLRFARTFVRQGKGMQLLHRAGLNQQSSRFPSWIPDWTVKIPSGFHDSGEGGTSESYSASGSQRVKIKCAPDTDELIVEGIVVDVVESISTSSNLEQEWENYFQEIDAMVNSLALSPLGDSREDLKWKVPIANMLYPKAAVSGDLDLRSSYRAFRQYVNERKPKGKAVEGNSFNGENTPYSTTLTGFDANVGPDSLQEESMSYTAALQETLSGGRFVTTKRGYVGVVPNMAQVSDTVAIFKGGRVPFILQKSIGRPQAFRLVGECYIHGIMNGEGLSLQGVVESEFRLH